MPSKVRMTGRSSSWAIPNMTPIPCRRSTSVTRMQGSIRRFRVTISLAMMTQRIRSSNGGHRQTFCTATGSIISYIRRRLMTSIRLKKRTTPTFSRRKTSTSKWQSSAALPWPMQSSSRNAPRSSKRNRKENISSSQRRENGPRTTTKVTDLLIACAEKRGAEAEEFLLKIQAQV